MKAEIISVGTEILLGHIVNTNANYLSKKLAEVGVNLYYQSTVGDNPARLVGLLEQAISRSDIVITTGGLGPTVDDITLNSVGSVTSRALVFDKTIEKYVINHYKRRGVRRIPKEVIRQAYIPRGARWFENKVGTAPAILVKHDKKLVVALPGPPRELIPLFENNIIPYLKKKGFAGKNILKTKTIKIAGLVEAEVNKRVKDLLTIGPRTTMGIYVHLGEIDLKITSKAKNKNAADKEIAKIEKKIRQRLGNYIYGTDGDILESIVGKMLLKKGKTLTVAESCTGGLIANRITNVSGSSRYFKMGIVAYSNEAKEKLLGVSKEKLKRYGTVSKEVALAMAEGARALSKADITIGVTGIAGPTGGTKSKSVGLIYIAVVGTKIKMIKECHFLGNREDIKLQTSITALDLLRIALFRTGAVRKAVKS